MMGACSVVASTAGPAAGGGAADANGAGRLGDGRLRCGSVLQPKRGRRRRLRVGRSPLVHQHDACGRHGARTLRLPFLVGREQGEVRRRPLALRSALRRLLSLRGRHGGRQHWLPVDGRLDGPPLRPEAGRTCVVCSPRLSVFLFDALTSETSLTHSPLPTPPRSFTRCSTGSS